MKKSIHTFNRLMFCASGCWCSSTHGKHTTTSRIYETLCYFLELMRASIFPMWFSCVHNQPFVLLRFHGWEQSQLESVHEKKGKKHLGTLGDRDATVTHPWYGYTLPWNGYTLPWNDHTLPWRMPPPKIASKLGGILKKQKKQLGMSSHVFHVPWVPNHWLPGGPVLNSTKT